MRFATKFVLLSQRFLDYLIFPFTSLPFPTSFFDYKINGEDSKQKSDWKEVFVLVIFGWKKSLSLSKRKKTKSKLLFAALL